MQRISIHRRYWQQICSHASEAFPEEACGLLAGRNEQVYEVLLIQNMLHSPVKYKLDPADQLRAFLHIEESGLELIGIFHSHPTGPDFPSETDVAEAYYPDCAYIILFSEDDAWNARAFMIDSPEIKELPITILEDI